MTETAMALWGIALNSFGVITLFTFGMPFRVPTGGTMNIIASQTDARAANIDKLYTLLGVCGLALVLGGSAMQAYAVWLGSSPAG